MKDKSPDARETYRQNLKMIIKETRDYRATPVLVTSMERKKGVKEPTLRGYPDEMRRIAKEEDVVLIDLNTMSKQLYKALGPNLGLAFKDGSHHNAYGSYQLAKCVVEGLRQSDLPLARFVVDDLPRYDATQPDPVDDFHIQPSPIVDLEKPAGS